MPKRSIRSQFLAQRRALGRDSWTMGSNLAQQRLIALDEFNSSECIALYAPIHNEIDTTEIMVAALKAGKKVLYPAVCGTEMVFREISGAHSLRKGAFGILEPCATCVEHPADQADLIVVPGVAFDLRGHRIGYGKGFYDRFLQHRNSKSHLVGLCHDFQLIDDGIPGELHDITMGIIISDKRIIRIAKEVTETA
jgi:5-formyltetrahydrofolate cyclo-ligase